MSATPDPAVDADHATPGADSDDTSSRAVTADLCAVPRPVLAGTQAAMGLVRR